MPTIIAIGAAIGCLFFITGSMVVISAVMLSSQISQQEEGE